MKKRSILLAILLTFVILNSQAVTWVQKAYRSQPCKDACAFVFKTDVCVGSGFDGANYLADVYAYTPSANSWGINMMPALPVGKANCACGGSGGNTNRGFIGFGYPGNFSTNNFNSIAPFNMLWSTNSSFNSFGLGEAFGVTIGKNFYVGTGASFSPAFETAFWKYDFNNFVWTQMADMPGPGRVNAFAFNLDNIIYAGGGTASVNTSLNDFYSFNDTTNVWTTLPSLPGANGREDAVSFAINGLGYVGLGNYVSGASTPLYSDFFQYDPISQTWTSIGNFPAVARYGVVGASLNGKGYVGMGMTASGVYKNDWWEFTPTPTGINEDNRSISSLKFINQTGSNSILIKGFKDSHNYSISIKNITGQLIAETKHKFNSDFSYNTSSLAQGNYIVAVSLENEVRSFKFIKN